MKNLVLLLLLLLAFRLPAQVDGGKGVTPLSPAHALTRSPAATRAVVIGISDYQDPTIPDLRFADRDAEAFAGWLRSPAGGSLPETQVKTLLNRDATTGKIIAALDALISTSKAGDEAIIYFSGHGDVERVTKFQRGYWLTWDSPPAVYAAGAFSLVFLQDIITTLSDNGVQVIVVSDACRAGKLAGSEYGGSGATSAALAQQFANEIKILSCQPEEFSLEGEQWGGGRGAFSFHLVDALYGLADANADGTVNLLELGRYLEDRVPAETAPHSQIPFTVGGKATPIARVNAEALARWRLQKQNGATQFAKVDMKGLEEIALARADSSVRAQYAEFAAALERGDLMEAKDSTRRSANALYEVLIREPALADLHGAMTRNFAAALMDEGQQVLNGYVKGDMKAIEAMESTNAGISHRQIADNFYRAAELLGERHYYHSNLKAKGLYFEAYASYTLNIPEDSAMIRDVHFTRKALVMDPDAPYLLLNMANMLPLDSIDFYVEKLNELAPNWAFGNYILAEKLGYEGRIDKAVEYYSRAIRSDSNYLAPYIKFAGLYDASHEKDKAAVLRETAIRIGYARITKDSTSLAAQEWHMLAEAFRVLRRYSEAEWAVVQAEKFNPDVYGWYDRSYEVFADMGKYDRSIANLSRWMDKRMPGDKLIHLNLGSLYFLKGDYKKAEESLRNGLTEINASEIRCDLHRLELARLYKKNGDLNRALAILDSVIAKSILKVVYFEMAEIHRLLGQNTQADSLINVYLNQSLSSFSTTFSQLGNVCCRQIISMHRLGKWTELKSALEALEKSSSGDPWYNFLMGCYYAQTEQLDLALQELKKAETIGWYPNTILWFYGTVKDPFLDPLRHLPEFQAWEKRWGPPYKDYSKN